MLVFRAFWKLCPFSTSLSHTLTQQLTTDSFFSRSSFSMDADALMLMLMLYEYSRQCTVDDDSDVFCFFFSEVSNEATKQQSNEQKH